MTAAGRKPLAPRIGGQDMAQLLNRKTRHDSRSKRQRTRQAVKQAALKDWR